MALEAGATVRLTGLKTAHLNGEEGRVLNFVEDTGRWVVELSSGEQKSLKPENLVVIRLGKARGDGRAVQPEVAGRMASDQESGFVLCPSLAAAEQAIEDGERRIELNSSGCVDFACKLLAEGSLQGLSFAECGLSAGQLRQLAACLRSGLVAFGISKNPGVEPEAWRELFEALPDKVTWLDFGDNQLGDGILPLVHRLAGREELDKLYLDGNSLRDIDELCVALPDTGITQLDLGDNELDEHGATQLGRTLPKTVVMVLVLGQNPISAVGCRSIVEGLARMSIDTLYLNDTGADDDCLKALAMIAADAKISELHLDSTKITEDGLRELIPQLSESQLNYLDISGNDISDETAQQLEQALAAGDSEA